VIPESGRLLGVDLGSRRIGVAVTDSGQTVATGVTVLSRCRDRAADHQALAVLVAEYGAVGVVIGVPMSLSGKVGPAAANVLREVAEIRSALGVDVVTQDERLTTRVAAAGLRAGGRGGRDQRSVIDQSAAAALLQTWVERRSGAGCVPTDPFQDGM
jgi:putative Holliday junction resolvase